MLKEPEKLVRFVSAEHFAAIYESCSRAGLPKNPGQNYTAEEWWRALVVTAYMTGWRISELMALRRDDLNLEAGTAVTRHADNKGNRDEVAHLHPVVVGHLRRIAGFHPLVFQWRHDERTLWTEYARIQQAAGIHLPCREKHDHTPSCHVYGFHDLRRAFAFATVNAPTVKPETLQKLMRHKSYSTTLRYVNLVDQVREAVEAMPVPEVLRRTN